jgi:hypothetical protein
VKMSEPNHCWSDVFWDITPCNHLEDNRCFRGTMSAPSSGRKNKLSKKPALACSATAFRLVSCSAYSSALKMKVICSSETSVDFQRPTHRYIPRDSDLHNHRCENLKSYKLLILLRNLKA